MGLRATWLILFKDVRSQVRNRTVLIIGLIAPLTLAFALNFVFGGTADATGPVTFDVGIVDGGGKAPGSFGSVVDGIARDGLIELHPFSDEAAARAAVENDEVGAAWLVSPPFADAVGEGREIVVVGSVDAPNTVAVAEAIAKRYAITVGTARLAAQVAIDTGLVGPAEAPAIAREVATGPPLALLQPIEAGDGEALDLTTSLTAGLALLFGFFVAGLPLTSLLEERAAGTLGRLLVAPISAGAIVAGKALAAIVLGVASLATLMVASSLLMAADWGPPLGALILAAAFVAAAVGLMAAAGSAAKTAEQASNVQGITAMALGLLGGAFVPIPRRNRVCSAASGTSRPTVGSSKA